MRLLQAFTSETRLRAKASHHSCAQPSIVHVGVRQILLSAERNVTSAANSQFPSECTKRKPSQLLNPCPCFDTNRHELERLEGEEEQKKTFPPANKMLPCYWLRANDGSALLSLTTLLGNKHHGNRRTLGRFPHSQPQRRCSRSITQQNGNSFFACDSISGL